MRHSSIILIFALTLSSLALAGPQAAEEYGFDGWPGKNGALKQGVALWDVSLPAYEVHSRRDRLTTSGEVIVRFRDKGGNKPIFEVALRVFDGVHEAQEHLLTYLDTSTLHLPFSKTLGLDVGDVAFATMNGEVLDNAVFTRNNVYVRVSLLASSACTSLGPLVSHTARKIDQTVEAEKQTLKAKGLSKPKIKKFGPASLTLRPNEPTDLHLQASDPLGGSLEYHFDEAGGMVWQEQGRWMFMAEKPLTYTVSVYVLNEHFLMATRSVSIEVIK
ncbi:MAG: hypothetical protein JRG91_12330 [Deltaproteobacteria bacterium]|nr:hypothetical protein [Deltaproteobacteria bacterium]